jgi:hypothetical protein
LRLAFVVVALPMSIATETGFLIAMSSVQITEQVSTKALMLQLRSAGGALLLQLQVVSTGYAGALQRLIVQSHCIFQ